MSLAELPSALFQKCLAPHLAMCDLRALRLVSRRMRHLVDELLPVALAWSSLPQLLRQVEAGAPAARRALGYIVEHQVLRRRLLTPPAVLQLARAACRSGQLGIVQLLTQRCGLSLRKEPADCFNTFCIACEHGQLEIAKYLAVHHHLLIHDVRQYLQNWPLRIVCAHGDMKLLHWMLEYFPFHARDVRSCACHALRLAAANGHVGVLQLLKSRFPLESKDARMRHNEALRMACASNHAAVVDFLLTGFALGLEDLAAMDAAALRWAVTNNCQAVLRVLRLHFGAPALQQLYLASQAPNGVAQYLDQCLGRQRSGRPTVQKAPPMPVSMAMREARRKENRDEQQPTSPPADPSRDDDPTELLEDSLSTVMNHSLVHVIPHGLSFFPVQCQPKQRKSLQTGLDPLGSFEVNERTAS